MLFKVIVWFWAFLPLLLLVHGGCPDTLPGLVKWSSSSYNNAQKPNDDVLIPAGTSLLLDVPLVQLHRIIIQGVLVLAPTLNHNLTLLGLEVVYGGQFHIGSEDCPFPQQVNIQLVGEKTDTETNFIYGVKYIVTDGGQIEMHGLPMTPWTYLTTTAGEQNTSIIVAGDVNWQVGQDILIAYTDYYYPAGSETRTIEKITSLSTNPPTTLISFPSNPLNSRHYADTFDAAGTPLTIRAEVALLSRNIVVSSIFTAQSLSDMFGGHTICIGQSICHYSNVEYRKLGQSNVKGRYPVHFHEGFDQQSCNYAKNLAIRDSYQRCLVVHGTNSILVENVVGLNSTGHCIYLEDAVEKINTFNRVLAVNSIPPPQAYLDQGLINNNASGFRNHDYSTTNFWITNPLNSWIGCASVGAQTNGIWFAPPDFPIGLAAGGTENPIEMPNLVFINNSAHSNGGDGIFIDGNGGVQGAGNVWMRPRDHMQFANSTPDDIVGSPDKINWFMQQTFLWKNRGNGGWCRGDSVFWDGLYLIDNGIGFTFAGEDMRLNNGIFMVDSPIEPTSFPYTVPQDTTGYKFYHANGPTAVSNSKFINYRNVSWPQYAPQYPWRTAQAISVDGDGAQVYQGRSRWYNVQFINCDWRLNHQVDGNGPYDHYNPAANEFNLLDTDGSLSGTCGMQFLAQENTLAITSPSKCRNLWHNIIGCDPDVNPHRDLQIRSDKAQTFTPSNSPNGDPNSAGTLTIVRLYDQQVFTKLGPGDNTSRNTEYEIILSTNADYLLKFGADITPDSLQLTIQFTEREESLRLAIPYPPNTVFTSICVSEVELGGCLTPTSNFSQLNYNTYYWDNTLNLLWIQLGSDTNRFMYLPLTNPYGPFITNEIAMNIQATCTANAPPNPANFKCYAPNVNPAQVSGTITYRPPSIPRCGEVFFPGQQFLWTPSATLRDYIIFDQGAFANSWTLNSYILDNSSKPSVLYTELKGFYQGTLNFMYTDQSTSFVPLLSGYSHLSITIRTSNFNGTLIPNLLINFLTSDGNGNCNTKTALFDGEISSPYYHNNPPVNSTYKTFNIALSEYLYSNPNVKVCGFTIAGNNPDRVIGYQIASIKFSQFAVTTIARSDKPCFLDNPAKCSDLLMNGISTQLPFPIESTRYLSYFGLNSSKQPINSNCSATVVLKNGKNSGSFMEIPLLTLILLMLTQLFHGLI